MIDQGIIDQIKPILVKFKWKELEKLHLIAVLEHFKGNRMKSAHALGMAVKTIRNKMNDYDIAIRSEAATVCKHCYIKE